MTSKISFFFFWGGGGIFVATQSGIKYLRFVKIKSVRKISVNTYSHLGLWWTDISFTNDEFEDTPMILSYFMAKRLRCFTSEKKIWKSRRVSAIRFREGRSGLVTTKAKISADDAQNFNWYRWIRERISYRVFCCYQKRTIALRAIAIIKKKK